jgi:hypothetical protein
MNPAHLGESLDANGEEIAHKNPTLDYGTTWDGLSDKDVAFVQLKDHYENDTDDVVP